MKSESSSKKYVNGSESGTEVTLGPGQYSIKDSSNKNILSKYDITGTKGDCEGTIGAGEILTCTIIYNDKSAGGGTTGGSGGTGGSPGDGTGGGTGDGS
jgi:hypothetical protein